VLQSVIKILHTVWLGRMGSGPLWNGLSLLLCRR